MRERPYLYLSKKEERKYYCARARLRRVGTLCRKLLLLGCNFIPSRTSQASRWSLSQKRKLWPWSPSTSSSRRRGRPPRPQSRTNITSLRRPQLENPTKNEELGIHNGILPCPVSLTRLGLAMSGDFRTFASKMAAVSKNVFRKL